MAGLIFGIIVLIIGVIVFFALKSYKKEEKSAEQVVNANGDVIYVTNKYGESVPKMKEVMVSKFPFKKYATIPLVVGIVFGCLFTFLGCTISVDTGKTGIVTTFGKVEDYTLEAGFHLKAPWNSVTEMDNRVQKTTVDLSCFSSDIQEVNMKYTLNYQIDKANAQNIYKTIGVNYYTTIIEPNIAEAVKVATAQFTAEKLVQTRSDLATSIETILQANLSKYNIKLTSTAIEDMDFTEAFTTAVENKQVAEQKKKQAVIEQEQALLEAENEKEIAKTKAEAEAAVATIKAEADMEVAKIGADSAEYQGKKEAAVAMQRLASINGWTVISDETTGINKLYKADGTEVSSEELKVGTEKLIQYYYTTTWNGVLPETYVGDGSASTIILGN